MCNFQVFYSTKFKKLAKKRSPRNVFFHEKSGLKSSSKIWPRSSISSFSRRALSGTECYTNVQHLQEKITCDRSRDNLWSKNVLPQIEFFSFLFISSPKNTGERGPIFSRRVCLSFLPRLLINTCN